MRLKIDEVFAFIADNEEGEGLVGHFIDYRWIPFVCADEARVESLRPYAEHIARLSETKIKLVRFSTREEIEVIDYE